MRDACRAHLDQDVVATTVHARCPDTNIYRNMIELRAIQRSSLPMINGMIATGFLRIGRTKFRVLPYTHSKAINLQAPPAPGTAEIDFINAAEKEKRLLL